MMINMQKCQLAGFFTQNKEHAVTELDTFGEVEPPHCVRYLNVFLFEANGYFL